MWTQGIWSVPPLGGPARHIVEFGLGPSFFGDGSRLAFHRSNHGVFTCAADGSAERKAPGILPGWGTEGEQALAVLTGGRSHLFIVRADGTDMRPIASGAGDSDVMPQWSADGGSLYFFRGRPEGSFRKVSLAGGPSVEVAPGWGSEITGPAQVSPDGRSVAYTVAKEGAPDVPEAAFVRDLATGTRTRLAVALVLPRWSHDGRSLVGHTWRENQGHVCPANGERCTAIGFAILPSFSRDDTKIYFLCPGAAEGSIVLCVKERDGSGSKGVAELPQFYNENPQLIVSQQGKLPWVQLRSSRRELWIADLKR